LTLSGAVLSGGKSETRIRAENDFYATPVSATISLLAREQFIGRILEPACGQGHIIKAIKTWNPTADVQGTDLVRRADIFNLGLTDDCVDFLSARYQQGEYENVITNPPFSLAREFIEKALEVASKKVAIFCKIQLLEGQSRKKMFQKTKLKTVYVFSKRVSPLRDGKDLDEKGKPWASTMCFAWFVWDKDYSGKPVIKWI
jgi:methylase of polypeptide subunit release factors